MTTGGWILTATALVVVILAVAALIAWLNRARVSDNATNISAHEILDQRLARGEITTDEHQQRRQVIDARPNTPGPVRPTDPTGVSG